MKEFTVKFKHVVENSYVAVVKAENYEEAMNQFEANPFAYIKNGGSPKKSEGVAFNVNEVKEGGKVVYGNKKSLAAIYV